MSVWRKEQTELRGTVETCAIVVVYENVVVRDVAIRLCDTLALKFIEDLEFDITWWRFDYLSDGDIAREASHAMVQADLILVCLEGNELPQEVQAWFEKVLLQRAPAEGALAVVRTLVQPETGAETYLRLAARRANLDYLPLAGFGSAEQLVDRLREDKDPSNTRGLNQTPDHPYHSSGWGINE